MLITAMSPPQYRAYVRLQQINNQLCYILNGWGETPLDLEAEPADSSKSNQPQKHEETRGSAIEYYLRGRPWPKPASSCIPGGAVVCAKCQILGVRLGLRVSGLGN